MSERAVVIPEMERLRSMLERFQKDILEEVSDGGAVDVRFIMNKDYSLTTQLIERSDDGKLFIRPSNKQNLCCEGSALWDLLLKARELGELRKAKEKDRKKVLRRLLQRDFGFDMLPGNNKPILPEELTTCIMELPFQRHRRWYLEKDRSFEDLFKDVKKNPDIIGIAPGRPEVCLGYFKPNNYIDDQVYVDYYNHAIDSIFEGTEEGTKEAFLEFVARMIFEDRRGVVAPVLHLMGLESSGKSALVQVIEGLIGGLDIQAVNLGTPFFIPKSPVIYAGEVKAGTDMGHNKKTFSDTVKQYSKETGTISVQDKNIRAFDIRPHFYTIITSNEQVLVETPESKLDNVVGLYLTQGKNGQTFFKDGVDTLSKIKTVKSGGELPVGAVPIAFYRDVLWPVFQGVVARYKAGEQRREEFQGQSYVKRLKSNHTAAIEESGSNLLRYLAYIDYLMEKQALHKLSTEEVLNGTTIGDLENFGITLRGLGDRQDQVRGMFSNDHYVTTSQDTLEFLKVGLDALPLPLAIALSGEGIDSASHKKLTFSHLKALYYVERSLGIEDIFRKPGADNSRPRMDLTYLYDTHNRPEITRKHSTNFIKELTFKKVRTNRDSLLCPELKTEIDRRINKYLVEKSEAKPIRLC